jgi:ATP-dependent protease HslVU (ClpYQ) peptidase subunit
MTCVVGWIDKKKNKVLIGGDSLASNAWKKVSSLERKVFKKGPIVFGCSGSYRTLQLIKYTLKIPEFTEERDVAEYLVTELGDALRKCMRTAGHLTKDKEVDTSDSYVLIGVKNRLFNLQTDFSFLENQVPYDSVGSGYEYALGACAIMEVNTKLTPEQKITRAVEVASMFDPHVGGDIYIEST